MKKTYSIRMTDAQAKQIEELEKMGFGNRTTIITTAIDRMYQEEVRNKKAPNFQGLLLWTWLELNQRPTIGKLRIVAKPVMPYVLSDRPAL